MSAGKFGRYQIKGEIGRGGMATVFHAYDPLFERDVAIKVLPREFLHDPQFRARFEREAKLVASLEHSAIVPVYDFGEEGGQPYLVMRYLSGGSLATRIDSEPLSLDEVVTTISRLAPALDAAHAKNIIHRDLKPANILYDNYGNAFLSDFGIAHLAQSSSLTLTGGAILGTPTYMSPEQVQGDQDVDNRSDLYAMGVMIYQMLVGEPPYHADTTAKLMMMHVLEPVPHIRDVDSEFSIELDNVIATSMAKNPNDRYQSAEELAEALTQAAVARKSQPFEAGEQFAGNLSSTMDHYSGSTAASMGGTVILERPKDRRWLILGGVFLLLAIAVVGFASGMINLPGSPSRGEQATLTAVRAEGLVAAGIGIATTSVPSVTASPTDSPTSTPQPSPEPTDTTVPTDTPTLAPSDTPLPVVVELGGGDMIAFSRNRDIWVVKLDGSDLTQLTTDGGTKSELQWTPDGQGLVYVSGLCVKMVQLSNGQVNDVMCFEYAGTAIEEFEISPDGSHVAISVNQELYIIPYDLDTLREIDRPSKVKAASDCAAMAPYSTSTGAPLSVISVRWSQEPQQMAVLMKIIYASQQEDAVRLIDFTYCDAQPTPLDEFPSSRFRMGESTHLDNIGFDGFFNFAMIRVVRNEGFGDLYFYNSDLHKPDLNINPIDGKCCYRDPSYSPDGSYITFAFQDIGLGAESVTQLYYIPVGTMFTGISYVPIPLPEGFFTNVREGPQPVVRPVGGQP